jgi:hypothetical protein
LDDSQKRKDDEVQNGTRLNQISQRYSPEFGESSVNS